LGEEELTITGMRLLLVTLLLTAVVAPAVSAHPVSTPAPVAGAVPTALPAPTGQAAQALAGTSLFPAELTAQALTGFTLEIVVNCGIHADAASVEVSFDPAYLQVVAVTPDESEFPVVVRKSFDNVSGTILYDAGSLECHSDGTCPSGVIRVAMVRFRALGRTSPTSYVAIKGETDWVGDAIFEGEGDGSTITITSAPGVAYLPLVARGSDH